MSATIVAQLEALRAHLAAFELPELYSVHVLTASDEPTVTMQLAAHQAPQIAAGLLAWADTLTDVTTEAWRVPRGDSVHLSVIGQLTEGITICVYGGLLLTPHGIGADLTPGGRKAVPLEDLRHLATFGGGDFLMASTEPTALDIARMTRAQRAALPLSAHVAQVLAEQHGVCVRPLAMRRIDTTTGRVEVVPVPCGSTREDQCRPCAEKARRLRMVQCREGWHLETEPVTDRATPSEDHTALMATRADLLAAYGECREAGDEASCEQIAASVADLDTELRALGVRGRLTPLDPPSKPVKRSTRRRQDAPDLPRRPIEHRTVGRVFAGRYRPSTFLTLTLDSYGRVDGEGAAVDPDRYDYRRAARDAIHFPALVDRFWQNTRRCVGWEVQYFGTVEPQQRGAPHFHAAIRGAIPRAELRAITAATYHQVWWPAHDQLHYGGERLPVWDSRTKGFTDPDTGQPLPTFEQACEELTEPAHVVRFGAQVHVKGILGGTEEAGRHIGYLTKYLTKSVGQAAGIGERTTDAKRDHAQRLHAELRVTPCSPRCPVWLLYGIQPHGARHSMTPGQCKGKAHKPEHLGIAGRRVLVSRKWSNKTLDDHRAERGEFVRQLLQQAGVQPAHGPDDGPYVWERPGPADPDVPARPVLLLRAVAERQRWKAEYTAAQLAANGPPPDQDCSATSDQAA